MKQSNWILGLGIFVAIVLIITTIWFRLNNGDAAGTVINKSIPEIGQSINQVQIKGLNWLASIIKTVN